MADVVIALPRKPRDVELLERCRHLLKPSGDINEYSQLIAPDHLATLRHAIEASLTPASPADVAKAVAVISVSFKVPGPDVLKDPRAFSALMINDLDGYPADILNEAIQRLRRDPKIRFVPAIGEIVGICDELVGERRWWLHTIDQMMEEHHRRRKKAEREAEPERVRRRLREEQAARIRALHGDAVAVSPEEIELATYLRPIMHWPIGKMFAWHECLDRGELWAARHCRRLALAERARRAELKGLIQPGHAVAIVRLAIDDEPAARWKLADEIGDDPFAEQFVDHAPCSVEEGPDFNAAVMELEAAAWKERGIFEGDLTLPGPLVQNDRFNERFGPAPDATLNFKEDPQQTAAALKRAKEVLQLQR